MSEKPEPKKSDGEWTVPLDVTTEMTVAEREAVRDMLLELHHRGQERVAAMVESIFGDLPTEPMEGWHDDEIRS